MECEYQQIDVQVEILVEEPSMELFLRGLLPRVLPVGFAIDDNCFIRPHEGKQDLQRSLVKKVKSYPYWPKPVKLIVIHDQDSNDCKVLKQNLIDSVRTHNEELPLLVRIACRELENWYIGDLRAVNAVYPDSKADKLTNKRRYARPDQLQGAQEMEKLSKLFSKSDAARRMSAAMNIEGNTSESFQQFIRGIQRFLSQ